MLCTVLLAVAADPARAAIATDVLLSRDSSVGATSITTASFSTSSPNELLLAFVATDGSAGMTVTGVTGGGLTWELVQRTNVQLGTAEIWRAFAPATLSNVTVRADLAQTVAASLTVVSFTGVDASGSNGAGAIGATGTGNAFPGAPSATLVTTRDNSWVWGVGNDWENAISRTLGSNQTMVHEYLATVDDTYWVQRQTSPTPLSGTSVTIDDTAPATDSYNLSSVEILPSTPLPMYRISGTVFEDLNYGGGVGRDSTAASGVGRPGARVELYDASGAFVTSTTTQAGGAYEFTGLATGDYTVRVVNDSVSSSRAGYVSSLKAVQTFRTDATGGSAIAVADHVGGEVPSKTDAGIGSTTLAALTTATTTAQSIAPVAVAASDISGVDFGFNFDTIVNTNNAGQGSLRQWITNARTLGAEASLAQSGSRLNLGIPEALPAGRETSIFMVSDGQAHPGLRAGIANQLTAGVAAVSPTSLLPAITGTNAGNTVLDGTTQTFNVGDTIAGVLGAGGTVGVDGLPLNQVPRPEVQLSDGAGLARGVDLQVSNTTVRGIAFYGFGNARFSDTDADVRVGASASGVVIEQNVIGSPATSFADPGAVQRSGGDHVRSLGGDSGIIRDNLIGYGAGTGIAHVNASDGWLVERNELRGDGIGGLQYHEIDLNSCSGSTVRGNLMTGTESSAMHLYASGAGHTVVNNTISAEGNSSSFEDPGIVVESSGETLDRNIITGSWGAGILVGSGSSGNTFTRNAIFGNGATTLQIGIDLLSASDDPDKGTSPFRTLNDSGDGDAGGNGLLNFPVLGTASVAGSNLVMTGFARPGSNIDFFLSDGDASGFGEGQTYLFNAVEGSGSDADAATGTYGPGAVNGLSQGTDTTNRFSFTVPVPGGVSAGSRLTATATLAGATSEFSGVVTVSALTTISGTVFEDVDYGGGAGRTLAGSSGIPRSGARVELYDGAGNFSAFTPTDATGNYAFPNLSAGTYTVRVVNSTVTSSRTGYVAGLLPVQTFRTDASGGGAVPVNDHVGGEVPGMADAGNGATTLAALTTATTTAQSIAPVTVGSGDVAGVDFGFNFDTIVNVNDAGQGSLRQFLTNANALSNAGLAQGGRAAGIENAIWMLADGTARPGTNAGFASLFVAGVATIAPTSALPAFGDPAVLDAQTQPGWSTRPLIELNGAGAGAGANGLWLTASGVTVRGLIINRFSASGLQISGTNALVAGNWLGLDATGTLDRGNAVDGITTSANNATIGGTAAADRNVSSGNDDEGVDVDPSIAGVVIKGNYIGTNWNGMAAVGNGGGGSSQGGILAEGVGTQIGGSLPNEGNLISGNLNDGIYCSSTSNVIEGNRIGTDNAGTAAIPNNGPGILIVGTFGGSGNRIGGGSAGQGNTIAFNTGGGIRLAPGSGTGNALSGNSTYSNTGLGSDLNGDGVTANDGAKTAGQPNLLMDFPVFTSAALSGTTLTVAGYVGSGSSPTFANARVEVFKSDNDPSGNGEGQSYLGFLTADANGDFAGSLAVSGLAVGDRICATATDASNNTSEFGANALLASAGITVNPTAGLTTTEAGATATFTVVLDSQPTADVTLALSSSDLTEGTVSPASLTFTAANWSVAQTVTATGVDDVVIDGDIAYSIVTAAATSADPVYDGQDAADVSATNTDNDAAGGGGPFVVNSTGDATDDSPGDGQCSTGGLNSQGQTECTLRAAIQEANAWPGADSVKFDIPTTESGYSASPLAFTIRPGGALPDVTEPATIDGTTQPGFAAAGRPVIELDGLNAAGASGLRILAGSSTVRGLVVNRFPGAGIELSNAGTNAVVGNFIGTDVTGSNARGNGGAGVLVSSSSNAIGGPAALDRNVISGNIGQGILATGPFASGNLVVGNLIGLASDGSTALGNLDAGVTFDAGAHDNRVGGRNAGEGNRIANNRVGAATRTAASDRNAILGNSLSSNAGLGIDLDDDGVTANDAGDPDAGGNEDVNYPVLSAVVPGASATRIQGTLNGLPSAGFRLEYFTSSAADPSGYGEGATLLAVDTVQTDASGNATIATVVPVVLAAGTIVTATATDAAGNTSEFSAAVAANPALAQTPASVAEIAPNLVVPGAAAVAFAVDVLPTIGPTDAPVDGVDVTAPAGFGALAVQSVTIASVLQGQACPAPGPGQVCATVVGQTIQVRFGTSLTTSGTRITLNLTADTPPAEGLGTFGVALVSASGSAASAAGNADGDPSDANSLAVLVRTSADPGRSWVTVNPAVVDADGVATSTVTTTLRDAADQPVAGRTILLSSDRGASDIFQQPPSTTDASGVAVGTVRSSVSGVATLTARVVEDSVDVANRPRVTFTRGAVVQLDKSAGRERARVGQVVPYALTLWNQSAVPVSTVWLDDRLPPHFRYVRGSARLNGVPVPDPTGSDVLTFDLGSLAGFMDTDGSGTPTPGDSGFASLSYQLVVGAGASPGSYENAAVAYDACPTCAISNESRATVRVEDDPFFTSATVIGRVFEDTDRDGRQGRDERGVASAVVVMDEGTYVTTDRSGRFHIPDVRPGQRLFKIDTKSFPMPVTATTPASQIVTVSPGLLTNVKFGVVIERDTIHIGHPAVEGIAIVTENADRNVEVLGNVARPALLLNGRSVPLRACDVRISSDGLDEVLRTNGRALLTPVEFTPGLAVRADVKQWTLQVVDSKGDTVLRMGGTGAPPASLPWNGTLDDGTVVRGGEIYDYQLEVEYQDGVRTQSPRRRFGVDRQTAISLTMTGSAFESGRELLSAQAVEALGRLAKVMRKFADERVVIEGHTDSVGTAKDNLELSRRRARAAADYLVNHERLPRGRFILRWYGEERPVASNAFPEGRELNRRVEIRGQAMQLQRAQLLDYFRGRPMVRLNGREISADSSGRFADRLDPGPDGAFSIEITDRQSRSVRARVVMPRLDILEPHGLIRLPYADSLPGYRSGPRASRPAEDAVRLAALGPEPAPLAASCRLSARTDPGNRVELDAEPVPVREDGVFTMELPLRPGDNTFGIVVRSPAGYARVANLVVRVFDRDERGRQVVARGRVPDLMVELPPSGRVMTQARLTLSGRTEPDCRVIVNGESLAVMPDGTFSGAVVLPEGPSRLEIRSVDPDGHLALIERPIEVRSKRLFLVALAHGLVGHLSGAGNLDARDPGARTGVYTEGRLAYYLKGYVAGRFLLTSAFDTGTREFKQLFQNLDDAGNDRLLINLDPDRFYPVYGDSSSVVYDAQSSGRFYLAVSSEELKASVGNYPLALDGTELASFRRTLFGAQAAYRSSAQSAYGVPSTEVALLSGEVRNAHVLDEIRATGGSLYYLSRSEVVEGSEQVAIVVRDKQTGLVLRRLPQQRGLDYTVKYLEGRLLFHRPISSVSADPSLVDPNLLPGHPVFLDVDYEARVGALEKSTVGGRVRQQLGDHLGVGATYVEDDLGNMPYVLRGADTEIRLGRKSRLVGEYAQSRGVGASVFTSEDGGVTYASAPLSPATEGRGWKGGVDLDLGERFGAPDRFRFSGYLKRVDPGFFSSGNLTDRGREKFGLGTELDLARYGRWGARYARESSVDTSAADTVHAAAERVSLQWKRDSNRWGLASEFQTGTLDSMSGARRSRTSLANGSLWWRPLQRLTTRLERQQTLQGPENDQTTLGFEFRPLRSLGIDLQGTAGSAGRSARANLAFTLDQSRVYLRDDYAERGDRQSRGTIFGVQTPIGPSSRAYSEYQWTHAGADDRAQSVLGLEKGWQHASGLRLVVAGEHAELESATRKGERGAVSTDVSYSGRFPVKASTRGELRVDQSTSDLRQWMSATRLEASLRAGLTLVGNFRYGETRDLGRNRIPARFQEQGVGLALRPPGADRVNALARYTWLTDRRLPTALDSLATETQMGVVVFEGTMGLTRSTEWSGKGALRVMQDSPPGVPAIRTHTQLWISRVTFAVRRPVLFGLEYRVLAQDESHDQRRGWLNELSWDAVEHMRLGVGYNFTDFSDNELARNDYSVSGWFIRGQARY